MGRNIETVHFPDTAPKLKRVAAYARVSSGKDAMLDHVTIYADGRMIYSFLNGSDITVML